MKILLTGASGVIGLKLIKRFFATYPDVHIDATYFSRGSTLASLKSNQYQNLNPIPYGLILQKDKQTYDQIWHFATYGQPARFIDSWQDVISLNSSDIITLSKLLKPSGRFHYASSSEIYGSQQNATEESILLSQPAGPRSIYTESKRLGEAVCSRLFATNEYIAYRICLAYSDAFYPDDKRVLYEFVMKGLIDNSINLLDDGSASRQYIFVDDAVDMMLTLSGSPTSSNSAYPVFNICNPEPTTILSLAETLGRIMNVPVYPGKRINPLAALDTVSVYPERFLNLFPDYTFTSLQTGLELVVKAASKLITSESQW